MTDQSKLNDFQILNKLGQGAFGQVWKVKRRQDNKEYALKKVKLNAMKQKQRQNAVNQIRILASLNNEYIIGYKDAFYDQASSNLCIVMEYASGGDILKKINTHIKNKTRFSQQQIWRALVHMTKGLKSLHDKKILHRDLKCANVFITNQRIYKLGDLNVSKVLKKGMAYTQTGTPYYASPEVWQDLPYDMKSDMWSLGCVIYEMAALRPPFQAVDLQGLFRKVKAGIFERIPSNYSNDLASIIAILLKVSPKLRPSTQQILNMPITAKYYKSVWNEQKLQLSENKNLLQTIKFNPYNLKALKDKLPRSNYFKQKQKVSNNEQLLELFQKMEKKKSEKSSIDIDVRNRQRVISACGRVSNNYYSPRIQNQEKKVEVSQLKIIQNNNPIKLPPKPPSVQNKLPPKPQIFYYNPNSINKQIDSKIVVNNSYQDIHHNHQINQSIENSREKSKENLRKIAQNILNHNNNRIIRSNSVDRIQPSW